MLLLIAMRLPSVVQPAGGDQGLYAYSAVRLLAGDVPYVDMWDQKPPGIAAVYSVLLRIWPHESVVPAADIVAAACVAALLVLIGYRRFTPATGFGAAALFLLFGDPYLQRLAGVYVRGQCEPFIALAVAGALALLASRARRSWHLIAAGACLAVAVWLKYNALTYGLPAALAAWAWRPDTRDLRGVTGDILWIGAGFAVVCTGVLAWFAAHNALIDLRLATIDYNLLYSNETYADSVSLLLYPFVFPLERARLDMLWYIGGLGAVLLIRAGTQAGSYGRRPRPQGAVGGDRAAAADLARAHVVALGWVVAAILSIVVNGQRDLPNYFVQAFAPLALVGAAGLATLASSPRWLRYGAALVIVAGLWRVGADTPVAGMRLAGLPGLIENVRYDIARISGDLDRGTYLRRFRGAKHDAYENDELARLIRETTGVDDRIYVFGFSGGSVGWKSGRQSASRFFWSHPVLIEFEAGRPGYGSAGLLADLQAARPVLVALQKEEWKSEAFFMNTPALRDWLEAGYHLERDTAMFSVWRRNP